MTKVNIGIVQAKSLGDKSKNLNHAIQEIKKLAKDGAQIICLQELFLTDYFCYEESQGFFDLAEKIPGDTTSSLSAVAKEHNVVIIASLFEERAAGLYHNTAAVIDADGTYMGKYRKMHIPDDPGFYEKYYFTPGDLGYKTFETKFAKIGVLVCWDQWYPEAARLTSLMGAEILFYPTAIGWDMTEQDDSINQEQLNAWLTIQRSHAVANGVYVVSVNRVGEENGTRFWGNSFIANPFGSYLLHENHQNEQTTVQEIDLTKGRNYRQVWPFLRDRRIDSYADITKRYIDND